jgi:hypothetical protein
MGIPSTIGKIAIKAQGSGWGTAESSFAGATTCECEVSMPSPVQESIQAEVMRAGHFATTRVAGGKGPTEMSLRMPMHGWSTATPGATASGDNLLLPELVLLESVMGAKEASAYQGSGVTGGTATVVEIATGVSTDVGHAFMTAVSGGFSAGWVNTFTEPVPDTYTMHAGGFSAAPTAAPSHLLGGVTLHIDTTQPTPFTLQFLGADDRSAVRLWDCVVTSATISLNAREQPTLEVTIRAGNWTNDGTGGAPALAALTDRPQMPVCTGTNGARVADSTGTKPLTECSITISAEVVDQIQYDSSHGINRFVVTKRTVEVDMTAPAAATGVTSSILDDLTSLSTPGQSDSAVQIDANATPGRCLSVLLPKAQVMELQAIEDGGGLVAIRTKYEPALYLSDTASTGSVTAPGNTPFRLAFL